MAISDTTLDDSLLITSSDLVATKLVTTAFDGTNFGAWKRGMLIALSTKNKIRFVDGTQPKPASNSPNSKAWQRCNDLVFSWILNSVSDEIANSILYSATAKEAWDKLQERFGKTNVAQLYTIQQKLCTFSQGNDNVSTYFTKLKQIWDEIDAMSMNPKCTCTCTCGGAEEQKKSQQLQKIFQLLMGLNESYNVTRGTILMQNHVPTLGTVYNNLLQEEDQRNVRKTSEFQTNSASFYANNGRNAQGFQRGGTMSRNQQNFNNQSSSQNYSNYRNNSQFGNGEIQCNYCKKFGHTIDKCKECNSK